MQDARSVFDTLNTDYLTVHKTKEDLFWDTYMAISDDDAGFARAEEAYKNFISDPLRLASVRQALASLGNANADDATTASLRHGLKGWLALFEANIVDNDAARQLMTELIQLEADLFAKRRDLVLRHTNEAGQVEDATLSMLATNMATNRIEAAVMKWMEQINALGGSAAAIEKGFFQKSIAERSYVYQREIEQKARRIVGVNAYQSGITHPPTLLRV